MLTAKARCGVGALLLSQPEAKPHRVAAGTRAAGGHSGLPPFRHAGDASSSAMIAMIRTALCCLFKFVDKGAGAKVRDEATSPHLRSVRKVMLLLNGEEKDMRIRNER
jgi:hypothetical protein